MKFEEVLPALKEGKVIRHKRRTFKIVEESLVEVTPSKPNPHPILLGEELLSHDWSIIAVELNHYPIAISPYSGFYRVSVGFVFNAQSDAELFAKKLDVGLYKLIEDTKV